MQTTYVESCQEPHVRIGALFMLDQRDRHSTDKAEKRKNLEDTGLRISVILNHATT